MLCANAPKHPQLQRCLLNMLTRTTAFVNYFPHRGDVKISVKACKLQMTSSGEKSRLSLLNITTLATLEWHDPTHLVRSFRHVESKKYLNAKRYESLQRMFKQNYRKALIKVSLLRRSLLPG